MSETGPSKEAASKDDFFRTAPGINLPKGGGAIRGIGEKFGANPVTGTGSMTVPIATSPGRSGFGPQLSLSYDSGAGNGPFGFGWSLSLPSIARKTDKGLPRYDATEEPDVFILSGAEDLVPVLGEDADGNPVPEPATERRVDGRSYKVRRYRPRVEGLFACIEQWVNDGDAGDTFWRAISRDNVTTWYGRTAESRIADPSAPERVFSWMISESHDDRGNVVVYRYKPEDSAKVFEDSSGDSLVKAHERNRTDQSRSAQRYLKRIRYGNRTPYFPVLSPDSPWPRPPDASDASNAWLFEAVFDYGEHEPAAPTPAEAQTWPARVDPYSSYRAGFELRTYRICRRVLMFHHFSEDAEVGSDCLVRSTDLSFAAGGTARPSDFSRFSFLKSVTQSGYRRSGAGYVKRSLPPIEFDYSEAVLGQAIEEVDPDSLENLPVGLDGGDYRWTDLHGEGIPGILTEQTGAWLYKRNLSPLPPEKTGNASSVRARFAPMETVCLRPNVALASGAEFMDLAGDGQPDVVVLEGDAPGLYEHDGANGWKPFRPFRSRLNRDLRDPNLRFVDLDGDGHADVLITEEDAFVWHASLAEEGFGPARRVAQALDEERGPRVVFADGTQSIHLADLSGDGLSDIVRIRNGDVCYWPNLGYGRFGERVTMDNAPRFDHPDQFDQRRIRLADIDGSGTTDIIYLHRDGVRLYFNQSGNAWSEPSVLPVFPEIDDLTNIVPIDLLGNGTSCLVWSSPLPHNARRSMRYVDLMGGRKPHLLVRTVNNLGAETHVEYAPSTRFYLQDLNEGRPWITRLPFPVHVVARVESYDHVSRNVFVSRYAYHHGHFDGDEREFRGFGMVEQWDSQRFATFAANDPPVENQTPASQVPALHTRTWFHTGIFLGRDRVSRCFEEEYYREPGSSDSESQALLLPDTVLPDGLTPDEEREACRALRGVMLRQEVYADDAGYPGATAGQLLRAATPYTVTEQNYGIRLLQPRGGNRHAVFLTHARETLTFHYERKPADPRIQHALTLEVDDYGNALKQAVVGYGRREIVRVLDSQGVVSQEPNPELLALDAADRPRQTTTLLTYTENRVTEAVLSADTHRAPLSCETVSYELTGYPATGPELGPAGPPSSARRRYQASDFVESDPDLPGRLSLRPGDLVSYEAPATVNPCRRTIEWLRTLYRRDDLGGLLPLGALESLALPGESYRLAFTAGLLAQVFRRPRPGWPDESLIPDPAAVLGGQAGSRGGYLSGATLKADGRFPATDPDDQWWAPSGRSYWAADPLDSAAVEQAQARQHFYLSRRYRDPFGQDTVVDFDGYDLLLAETRDPLGNRISVEVNDYRVLLPRRVSDPNRNRAEVVFDALGLVVGTAVMGKAAPAPAEGDSLAGFVADLTPAQRDGFFEAADPHSSAAALLKDAGTRIVYDLDRFRRTRQAHPDDPARWQPACAATLARETHAHSPLPPQGLKIQLGFSYSDGFGREVQKKIQAEKGKAPQRDANGRIVVGADGQPLLTAHDLDRRWVGSGWTVFNNKGNPVRQYEPFFSDTHRFEFGLRVGVSPVLFYDPAGRVIATLHPNHTYEKVVFDPWRQTTYDVNDTCAPHGAQTGDPRTDPDIGGYVGEYFRTQAATWQTWHDQRIGGAMGAEERDAARKAAAHADTPTTAHFDTLGRPFLTVVRNRVACAGHDLDGTEEAIATRVDLDIEGNQRAVRDERRRPVNHLPEGVLEQRIVMRYGYDMLGGRVHQFSMEAGARWMLNDVSGSPLRGWDGRGHHFSTVYDALRRPIEQYARGAFSEPDPLQPNSDRRILNRDILVDRIEYGEGLANAEALNLRTRIYRHFDSAGIVTHARLDSGGNPTEAYDFKGNRLRGTRRLVRDYKEVPDWLLDPPLDVEVFEGGSRFDALNRPIQSVAPRSSLGRGGFNVVQPVFNEANLLERVDVWLERTAEPDALLDGATEAPSPVGVAGIDYDAKGQRLQIDYPNGVSTTYRYDWLTHRLLHLLTRRRAADFPGDDPQPPLPGWPGQQVQNLHYRYDPVGNITRIRDDAQQTVYFRNQRVEPDNDYVYDARYRLIQASGREHLGQGGIPAAHSHDDAGRVGLVSADTAGRFAPTDGSAMGTYVERYVYDAVGNFLQMQHRGTAPEHAGWTRAYDYLDLSLIENGSGGMAPKASNRLTRTTLNPAGNAPQPETYLHDAHGNMLRMPHLGGVAGGPNLHWDFRDRLQRSDLGGGGTAYYVYDASGQRVRKVWEKAPGLIEERIYLGGFEIFRRHGGPIGAGSATLERETLHVMDDRQRIALVETRTFDSGGSDPAPRQLIRYQFGNHLGSASLELDAQAQIVSYEEYSPYGSSTYQAVRSQTETAKRYRYTGKERDEESGLYYNGARYYSVWIGRWMAADPAGFVDGPDLYVYARLNPVLNSDPTGRATKQQFQHVIAVALEKAQAGNRSAVGTAAEAVLEGMLKKAGYTIIKGPVTNPGQHFADIVAYDPEGKELLFFDNKNIGNKKSVSRADAFVDVHDDAETAARKAGVIAEAQERFADIAHQLPADQLDDIKKAFTKAAADPGSGKFIIANATPKMINNLVERISQRLIDRGVRFADASGGSKKLKADIDAKLAKGADATADALEAGSSAGKQLLKSLPAIGLGISAGLAIPRVAQAAEEDLEYEEQLKELGEEPLFADLSVLRETALIGGEEGGGELGGWGGAALGASISWETGPGVIIGTVGGAILFGFAGDSIGGAVAGYLFDRAADSLYQQRMTTR